MTSSTIRSAVNRMFRRADVGSAELIRGELFSAERLEAHGVQLALSQTISTKEISHRPLRSRLRDNEAALLSAYRSFAAMVDSERFITPAAEWLLDNFHVVEEQIREIRQDLPPAYYRQLPQLSNGPLTGYPRVFGIAWEFVSHTDSCFEIPALRRFLNSYQSITPLTIGELWAVAITLRIVLVENLRRAAQRSQQAQVARADADELADELQCDPSAIATLLDDKRPITNDFVAQLVHRLRSQGPELGGAHSWLTERLLVHGLTPVEAVAMEHQRQSMANVTVRNIITSMRLMSEVDWAELFESVSLVDSKLRQAPGYSAMDFATRDVYRAAIERLGRGSELSELQIAALAVHPDLVPASALTGADEDDIARRGDPGYRLLSNGLKDFEAVVGYRHPLAHRLGHFLRQRSTLAYFAGFTFLTIIVLVLATTLVRASDATSATFGAWTMFWLCAVGLIPATDLALAVLNRAVQRRVGALALPSLALRDGVPECYRTMVVVPMLLTSVEAINEQVHRIEIHHLASLGGELHFALLADGVDADHATEPPDAMLQDALNEGIDRLNRTYAGVGGNARFFALQRHRVWNASEGKWTGWERKRGKLHELNRLLRGATDTTFFAIAGRKLRVPSEVKFVITLDADTRLPRDTVRRLIGKLAHPLNRPRFDRERGRVVEGYAILQPRVTPSLPGDGDGSLFQRVFSSVAGLDTYSAAASDVYQDLFGEGSYAGKGIYDVDAFEAALRGRVAPDSLLSHDLFEGLYARAGLASDVDVVEDFPDRYDVATLRQHRWTRGDWQLLPWIIGRPDASDRATSQKDSLPLISQWKMVDNLRRSLSAPAAVVALFAGWALPPSQALVWTAFVISTMVLPPMASVVSSIFPFRAGVTARSHLRALWRELTLALLHAALLVTFLAHQAWLMVDAIARSIYRLAVSRRHMLQWVTAAASRRTSKPTLGAMYLHMAGGVAIGCMAAIGASLASRDSRFIEMPLALLWLAAPAIAHLTSRTSRNRSRAPLSVTEIAELRLVARRTWRYFESFVTQEDHMLPPDNVQVDPHRVVAHRTSPTNIGLYLLATISARDFGWIGQVDALRRLEGTLGTMKTLQLHRGHFYNWYDTRDLRALEPGYVSSVDSGNLAAHLVTVGMACRESVTSPLLQEDLINGVRDALDLARLASHSVQTGTAARRALREDFAVTLSDLEHALPRSTADADQRRDALQRAVASAAMLVDVAQALSMDRMDEVHEDLVFWTSATKNAIHSQLHDLQLSELERAKLRSRLGMLAAELQGIASAMEFGFLFDKERRLLSIGYRPVEGTLDVNCYDLLASESRLASFFAIAKGDIPSRHWFRLGRALVPAGRGAALVSWSGSMFEYLMPSLVMREPTGSIIAQTNRLVVARQIRYAEQLGLPWGMSESAYNERDIELTYQYSNFGIPDLGLKRGLRNNAVIAPYATALAAMLQPAAAVANFAKLALQGALGRFGFFEAMDYTPARLPAGTTVAVVQAFMAHHQGMTIVAIGNALHNGRMRNRFHSDPGVQATELLLHERPPRDIAVVRPWVPERAVPESLSESATSSVRHFDDPTVAELHTHLLTNGRYSVMVTGSGAGYSRWNGLAITRWREDATRDDYGSFVFVRDLQSGAVWSAGLQPSGVRPASYSVTFAEDRSTLSRHDELLSLSMEVIVSPEDDAEGRCLTLSNTGTVDRLIELTSYCELVLAPLTADIAHPAFSKLFVHTEFDVGCGAVLAHRRKRDATETDIWVSHHVVVEGDASGPLEYETDRLRFVGRGREVRDATAIVLPTSLSGTLGTVLDPVIALRQRVVVAAGTSARLTFWTGAARSRDAAVALVDRHRAPSAFPRASMLAWTQAQVQLRHLGISASDACLFQRLAGFLIFAQPTLRPAHGVVEPGAGGPRNLWSLGISGDRPIALVRIDDASDIGLVQKMLSAQEYWQSKCLDVDLVILNERASSYVQDLQGELEAAVRTMQTRRRADGTDGHNPVFLLRSDLISPQSVALLCATARVVLYAPRGTLGDQLDRRARATRGAQTRRWRTAPGYAPVELAYLDMRKLDFFNGLGGFSAENGEYITTLRDNQETPAPWINVIANPKFGFQVAVEGSGYTWSLNSKENQLTPWSNDPVCDRPGEAIYLRDEETGAVWSPTASPVRLPAAIYRARHGQGYSRFEHASHEIAADLVQFVPFDDSVKISRLRLTNHSDRTRRLSVTAYAEWVLGSARMPGGAFITTSIDADSRVLIARNSWNTGFGCRVAFADLGGLQTHWTADRTEFIGRNGTLASPAALRSTAMLSGCVGAALDPCAALQAPVTLEPGQSTDIVFLLGDSASIDEARAMIGKYRVSNPDEMLREVRSQWDAVLCVTQVCTPDRGFDLMMNRWLLYQTIVCRVWARAAFYQASGAYGFRDQLQDGLALATAAPALTREHLLRAAARQFVQGDVQHWWLPHSGQGVRTRISDDRIWLGFCVAKYVVATGDEAVLSESVPFLEGQTLDAGEHEAFFVPNATGEVASLYEHCARALDQSLESGAHGLPLIGTGDWNDGLNRVGALGRGESVWLAWFLRATLNAFLPIAVARGDTTRVDRWSTHVRAITLAVEDNAWDGDWYRRAYYDDGTTLGSQADSECQIDSIAQSWSVLAGGANPERSTRAMRAVQARLIRPDDRVARLFTPPFDRTQQDPGYIKGYPPGVRENGGQYTHAATWSVMALATLGQGDGAYELFTRLSPIGHSSSRAGVERYKVEPYVVAADIYSVAPHLGRGGWTWYTGSSGWLYQAGLESILGIRRQGSFMGIVPCLPSHWPGVTLKTKYGSAAYEINIQNPDGVCSGVVRLTVDGREIAVGAGGISLVDDGQTHAVEVVLGTLPVP